NIRKELNLDKPKWQQFLYYLKDVSPVSVHTKEEIVAKQLQGIFIGGKYKLALKIPYFYKSYQTKKEVGAVLMEALP
ncbi:MAG TPA: ABC transporter permease, partial [Ferruginibacter sp.]|nr:ABC transporter permease [Ferruginibacter sp.]